MACSEGYSMGPLDEALCTSNAIHFSIPVVLFRVLVYWRKSHPPQITSSSALIGKLAEALVWSLVVTEPIGDILNSFNFSVEALNRSWVKSLSGQFTVTLTWGLHQHSDSISLWNPILHPASYCSAWHLFHCKTPTDLWVQKHWNNWLLIALFVVLMRNLTRLSSLAAPLCLDFGSR